MVGALQELTAGEATGAGGGRRLGGVDRGDLVHNVARCHCRSHRLGGVGRCLAGVGDW
jgi:hypothetical protein